MKKWMISLSLAAGVIGLSACSQDKADSEVVAETKAGNVTKDELYEAMKDKIGEQALQQLIYEKVLTKEYSVSDQEIDEKLNQIKTDLGANFEMALAQYGYNSEEDLKETIRIGVLQEKAAVKDIKVTEEEITEYAKQIKARHILVKDEKTANEVKQKLDKGEKFEELATQYSTDTGSAAQGGDLGWFGPGKMVEPFEKAAYALKVDEISQPVKTEHGYHIIQLTGKKADLPKEELERETKVSKLDGTLVQQAMEREMKDAKVKIKDKELEGVLEQQPTSAQ
jgi:foldase protein PrsA